LTARLNMARAGALVISASMQGEPNVGGGPA